LLWQHRIVPPHSPWTIKGKKWLLDTSNIASPVVQFLLRDLYDTIEFFDKKTRQ
jgi:poly(3-hydroxyalkanoate) synthetase